MSTNLNGPIQQAAIGFWAQCWLGELSVFEFQSDGAGPSGPTGSDISAEIQAIKNKHLKLLVVDDDPQFGKATKRWLSRMFGADVDYVESGAAAIAAINRCPYHCIFLDLMMPEMTGVETFQRLKGQIEKDRFVPMSGVKDGPEWIKAKAAGLDPIKKPFIDEPEVISAILIRF